MELKQKRDRAEFYHEVAQNTIVEALKHYLENVSWLLHPRGRPPKKRKDVAVTEVQRAAEEIEEHLEYINARVTLDLESRENEHE